MICSATLCNVGVMETPDFDSPSGRLIYARMRAGFEDAAQFARAVDIHPTTYRAYENGQNGFAKHAPRFAKRLGVTAEWLLEGGPFPDGEVPEPPKPGEFGTPELLTDRYNIALVRRVDIRYAMGDGTVIEDYPEVGFLPFDRDFLTEFTSTAPDRLVIVTGQGDSMEPTIRHGQSLMMDTGQTRVTQQDMIWALTYAGAGMIKRLRRLPKGKLLILSDNPTVPPQEADEQDIHIVGRIVWGARGM